MTRVPSPAAATPPTTKTEDADRRLDLLEETVDGLSGGGLSGIRVEEEGSSIVASASGMNFVGSAVTVTDGGSGEATVTITAGTSGITANRKTASYELVAGDVFEVIEMNVAGANNLTVPSAVFTAGDTVEVFQYGAGQTTIVAGSGMTLRSPSSALAISTQFGSATIRFISASEAAVEGRLA